MKAGRPSMSTKRGAPTVSCCGKQFRCSDLGLNYHEPEAFINSQWPCSAVLYLVYRWVALLYFLSWHVVHWAGVVKECTSSSEAASDLRFFTEWSYNILTINLLLLAVNVTWGFIKKRYADSDLPWLEEMPLHLKLSWLLYNVATGVALVVTFCYWAFLYKSTLGIRAQDFNRHATNSIYIITDLFITGIPIRLCHVYQPILFGIAWGIFSLVWAFSGGHPIYFFIDWIENPGHSAMIGAGLVFVAIPTAWTVIFGLYKVRKVIHSAIYRRKFQVKMDELTQIA